jgi:organic radical activating enzyme|tara:strand:+ start:194 stop:784 length:591 start_codon:yes stop_codon:yes gene_type:complete
MKPVKIKSNLDLFDITWRIILRCNYDCWYCKTDWHTKNEGDTPDVDKLIKGADKIIDAYKQIDPNKQIRMTITGGEPFLVKDLDILITHLVSRGVHFRIRTNGTGPVKVYKNMAKVMDKSNGEIMLSWHVSDPKSEDLYTKIPELVFQNVPVGVRLLGDQKYGREVDRAEMFLRNVGIPFEMVRVTDNPDDEDWDT